MIEYLKDCHGFEDDNFVILMDDGEHTEPTYENIIAAYKQLAEEAQPGDAVFCHYSGHGCSIRDDEQEEADGKDEALCPVDYASAGVIRDDDVYDILVAAMPRDVHVTCVMDCCHSGTILDLPYGFLADGVQEEMELDEGFDFGPLIELASGFASAGFAGLKQLHESGAAKIMKRKDRWASRFSAFGF